MAIFVRGLLENRIDIGTLPIGGVTNKVRVLKSRKKIQNESRITLTRYTATAE